jgi:hypothetical protein
MRRVVAFTVMALAACSGHGTSGPVAAPRSGAIVSGFTGSLGPGGANPLCIGQFLNDPHSLCGPLQYPGRKPGCVFLFNPHGGQKITARLNRSADVDYWQPITLDNKRLAC